MALPIPVPGRAAPAGMSRDARRVRRCDCRTTAGATVSDPDRRCDCLFFSSVACLRSGRRSSDI